MMWASHGRMHASMVWAPHWGFRMTDAHRRSQRMMGRHRWWNMKGHWGKVRSRRDSTAIKGEKKLLVDASENVKECQDRAKEITYPRRFLTRSLCAPGGICPNMGGLKKSFLSPCRGLRANPTFEFP